MKIHFVGTSFCQELLDDFIKQKSKVFDNPVFLAGMYLDPRFQFELTKDEKEIAIKYYFEQI
mgnify:CR=1 FL=1